MAEEWAQVPEYAESLNADPRLLRVPATSSVGSPCTPTRCALHGRSLFERWLDCVVAAALTRSS